LTIPRGRVFILLNWRNFYLPEIEIEVKTRLEAFLFLSSPFLSFSFQSKAEIQNEKVISSIINVLSRLKQKVTLYP